jgi:hypothetical protein
MSMNAVAMSETTDVMRFSDLTVASVEEMFARFNLELHAVPDDGIIPGTFWGEPEAGLIGNRVYVRYDTPAHSLLHEVCHCICMTADRRAALYRDAGGDDLEESAVCYLQIVLAEYLPGVGPGRLMRDMDAWGYSFRLGSTASWFERDALDARNWLVEAGLLAPSGEPRWVLRER